MDRLNFPMQKVIKNLERVRFDSGGGGKVSALFLRPEDGLPATSSPTAPA
jgi:hypothetical protein